MEGNYSIKFVRTSGGVIPYKIEYPKWVFIFIDEDSKPKHNMVEPHEVIVGLN